jgi:hypothetical protein
MEHFGLPSGGGSIVWMRQAGLLLLFISLLYLPGGINPELYKANAWLYAFRGRDASPQTFPRYPLDSAWFPVCISSGDCLR